MTGADSELRVVCATSNATLAPHLDSWRSLAEHARHGEWWAGPDWILPWLSAFGDSVVPAVHFVYESSLLVGVVPMVSLRRRRFGSARWTFPRNTHVRRIGWLSDIPPARLLAAVYRECRRLHPHSALALPLVPQEEKWEIPIESAIADCSLLSYRVEESASAVADLSNGWEAFLRNRDAKWLRSLKRHLKRLDPETGWQFECHRDTSTVDDGWQALLEIERRSWKYQNGSAIVNEPGTAALYEGVVQRFAERRALHLWILRHDGRAIAHTLGVMDRGCYFLLKNSFDEEYRSWSPGLTLVWHSMKAAAEHGALRIDFLGDASEWKRPLATEFPTYASWTIYPRTHLIARCRAFVEQVVKPLWRRARTTTPGRRSP